MGIDYFSCNHCGDSFPDVIDYVSCECGRYWCCDECAEEQGYKSESCKLGYDCDDNECEISCYRCENKIEASCQFCREEEFDDNVLLIHALKLLGKSREDLINDYKKSL